MSQDNALCCLYLFSGYAYITKLPPWMIVVYALILCGVHHLRVN